MHIYCFTWQMMMAMMMVNDDDDDEVEFHTLRLIT